MPDSNPGEVERLEAWQLAGYLEHLAAAGVTEVRWNRETLALAAARQRAQDIDPLATVVVDGATLYVAIPDHSADDAPRVRPIQLGPRRPARG